MIKAKGRLRGQMPDRTVRLSELMTVAQVREESGLGRTTIYYHTGTGTLPTYQVGNVLLTTRRDYDAWIARLRAAERAGPALD